MIQFVRFIISILPHRSAADGRTPAEETVDTETYNNTCVYKVTCCTEHGADSRPGSNTRQ